MIHTRAADDDTLALLAAHEGAVILHCFSSPPLLGEASSAAGTSPSPGTSPTRTRTSSARPHGVVPADRLLAETDSPYLAPQPVRGRRNEPAFVIHTYAALAEARGVELAELVAQIDANADAVFGL